MGASSSARLVALLIASLERTAVGVRRQIDFRPPYVGGAGWVGVELSKVDDDQLGALVREAFRLIAAKDRARRPR